MTSRSRASARGERRSRSSTARAAAPCPCPREQLPVLLPLDITPDRHRQPAGGVDGVRRDHLPALRRAGAPRDRHARLPLRRAVAVDPRVRPAEAREEPLEEILALPDLRHWLPSERVVAGSDSGNFVFDQRIVTKALRDIGPLAFLGDGEPFAGCLFHEMVISDGRKMSKHLGNVVDPDALVERYGADTVRLAVLYAARPQRSLNWSDSAVLRCHRFLTQVWEYSHRKARRGRCRSRARRRERWLGRGRRAGQGHHRAPQAETALAMVRDGGREDHRGHGEPGDAQRRAQRHASVRPDQGLREARARARGRS